jgi:hypothetical protein
MWAIEEAVPGTRIWEMTAGMGIVPKWVSVIGLLAVSAFIVAVVPWLVLAVGSLF